MPTADEQELVDRPQRREQARDVAQKGSGANSTFLNGFGGFRESGTPGAEVDAVRRGLDSRKRQAVWRETPKASPNGPSRSIMSSRRS